MRSPGPDVVHVLPVAHPLRGVERDALDLLLAPQLSHLDQRVAFLEPLEAGAGEWPPKLVVENGPGAPSVVRALARARPRLVHGWLLRGNAAGALLRLRRPGVTLLTSEHNVGHTLTPLKRGVERFAAALEHASVANCEAVRDAAVGRLARRGGTMEVIEHGVPAPTPPARVEACDCVMVGRLEAVKDHETALRAWRLVRERRAGARLVLVGGGPEEARLRALAGDLGLDDGVVFTGEGDPLPHLFGARIFLSTSRAEGLSRALLESLAAGTPVVATPVGGHAGLPPEAVVMVPPGDARAIADVLLRLLGDDAERERRAERGREAFERRFRLDVAAEAYARLYARLLSSG